MIDVAKNKKAITEWKRLYCRKKLNLGAEMGAQRWEGAQRWKPKDHDIHSVWIELSLVRSLCHHRSKNILRKTYYNHAKFRLRVPEKRR
uniref:Uncharacterized protein n=1 Tax=Romanomermis culicivorax TaxID=13658 RepID=A0A915KFI6_ROMCU